MEQKQSRSEIIIDLIFGLLFSVLAIFSLFDGTFEMTLHFLMLALLMIILADLAKIKKGGKHE